MEALKRLFEKNEAWAQSVKEEDSGFFERTSKGQSPEYLWIGCSDSRVPESSLLNLSPGEIFVHRNIANMVVHSDLNSLSVIQYAVEVLEVKHILVCGHYGCGGVKAALDEGDNGVIDHWLEHIKDVARLHTAELDGLSEVQKHDLLCELNVKEQVMNVCRTPVVRKAWGKGMNLSVHGLIYNLSTGFIEDLGISVSSAGQLMEYSRQE